MAGSDIEKPASTKRAGPPAHDSSSTWADAAKKAKVSEETATGLAEQKEATPPRNVATTTAHKSDQDANADANVGDDGSPAVHSRAGELATTSSNGNASTSSNGATPTSSLPTSSELESRLNDVFLILKAALKVVDIAKSENCTFAEAMPDVPGWSDAAKGVMMSVLERFSGTAVEGALGGMQLWLLRGMAREAAEVMAIIEGEGESGESGGSEDDDDDDGQSGEGDGEDEGVELAEWEE